MILDKLFGFVKLKNNMNKITLVTGLWDIGRGDLQKEWSRSFQHYLDKFQQLLQVDVNTIIFGDKEFDINESFMRNNLSEYNQEIFDSVVWVYKQKKLN